MMKATINDQGRLQVEAETSLERYALTKWAADHAQGGEVFTDGSGALLAVGERRYALALTLQSPTPWDPEAD